MEFKVGDIVSIFVKGKYWCLCSIDKKQNE